MSYQTQDLAPKGSTGTGTFVANGLADANVVAVEFEVEAVGSTPTVTFQVEGALHRAAGKADTDVADASDQWDKVALVTADSTVAATSAAVTKTGTGKYIYFVAGLDLRAFRKIRLNVSANTNVTFSARLHLNDVSK